MSEEEIPEEELPVDEELPVEEEELMDEALPEEEAADEEAPPEDEGVDDEVPPEEPPLEDEPVPEEEPPPEEALDEEEMVQEHLKDAVEGSLRLKRMLSRDDSGPDGKKRKADDGDTGQRPIVQAKVKQLLSKWACPTDMVIKHVLDQLTLEELTYLMGSPYRPERFHARKTAAELLAQHMLQIKERKLAGGGSRVDIVSCFRHRWSLDMEAEKKLRALTHHDLRYVLDEYNGETPLDDVISEASGHTPDEENTLSAAPDVNGIKVISRFNRLELIDPLADCAVFGDANLTFALNLARHRKDMGHVGRVIATTFEEIETLRERYPEIDESIKTLEDHHAEVYHGVDCTRVAVDARFEGMEEKLGAVYYNFPHSGAIQGFFDSHPMVNWRHENLMRLFFRALRTYVKPGGYVKVSSNAGAVGVRYSYIVESAIENEFLHIETMPFLEWHLHRYGRSYGDKRDVKRRLDEKNNQSYNAQKAQADMVYCFQYAPTGNPIGKQTIRFPPTLKTLTDCKDGPFKHFVTNMPRRAALAKELHERFAKEVSGTHVG